MSICLTMLYSWTISFGDSLMSSSKYGGEPLTSSWGFVIKALFEASNTDLSFVCDLSNLVSASIGSGLMKIIALSPESTSRYSLISAETSFYKAICFYYLLVWSSKYLNIFLNVFAFTPSVIPYPLSSSFYLATTSKSDWYVCLTNQKISMIQFRERRSGPMTRKKTA